MMIMIKNANHLPLNLLQYENERFRVRVKNLRRRLWLFKTWAFGDSGIRITNPSIAVRDCKSRTVGYITITERIFMILTAAMEV